MSMSHLTATRRTCWILFLLTLTGIGYAQEMAEFDLCGEFTALGQMEIPPELHLLVSVSGADSAEPLIIGVDESPEDLNLYPFPGPISASPSGNYVLYRTAGQGESFTVVIDSRNNREVPVDLVWADWIANDLLMTTDIENSTVVISQHSPITGMIEGEMQIELPGVPEENFLLFTRDLKAVAYVNQWSSEANPGQAVILETSTESIVWTSETQTDPVEFGNTAMWSNASHQLFVGSAASDPPNHI